jgi:hypothetical protein
MLDAQGLFPVKISPTRSKGQASSGKRGRGGPAARDVRSAGTAIRQVMSAVALLRKTPNPPIATSIWR